MKNLIDQNFEELLFVLSIIIAVFIGYNLLTLCVFVYRKILLRLIRKFNPQYIFNFRFPKIFEKLNFIKRLGQIINKIIKQIFGFHPKLYLFINLYLIISICVITYLLISPKPKVLGSTPSQNAIWENPESFLEVEFSRPIKVDKLQIHLAPEIKGEWRAHKNHKFFNFINLPFVTKMRFYPQETVLPNEDVIIYAVGYNPKTIGETMIEFKSPGSPGIVSSSADQMLSNFPIDGDIEFSANTNLGNHFSWRAEVAPSIEFDLIIDDGNNTIRVSPKSRLNLSTQYTMKLYLTEVSYNIASKEIVNRKEEVLMREVIFTTDSSPLVASIVPTGTQVLSNSVIKVTFGRELNKPNIESKFKLEPETPGTISWADNLNMVFTPTAPLAKATLYKVILDEGIEYGAGIKTKDPMIFDFETIGYAKVTGFNIANGASAISVKTTINVQFDQQVDQASAQGSFITNPTIAGTFIWQDNAMVFKPNTSLGYSTNYTITINPGVKSINGLDSNQEFKLSFKTEPDIFRLTVPYYRQVDRFECELVATRMALAYRGIYMSSRQIMNEIGVSTVPYDSATNTWGNPNISFVGDVTGASKGYGVHLDPLARVIRNHGRSATVQRNWNVAGIAQEVKNGNPVIILWQNGWSTPTNISWNTPEGTRIHAINGTHAGVVIGYKGSVSAPTAMIVQDPWYRGGSTQTYSISNFNALWSYHGNSALVVY